MHSLSDHDHFPVNQFFCIFQVNIDMHLQDETTKKPYLKDPDADMTSHIMGRPSLFKNFCKTHHLEFSSVETAHIATQTFLSHINVPL